MTDARGGIPIDAVLRQYLEDHPRDITIVEPEAAVPRIGKAPFELRPGGYRCCANLDQATRHRQVRLEVPGDTGQRLERVGFRSQGLACFSGPTVRSTSSRSHREPLVAHRVSD